LTCFAGEKSNADLDFSGLEAAQAVRERVDFFPASGGSGYAVRCFGQISEQHAASKVV